ncbi:MAG: D-alanyl-D-alanine carboxypeptidase [Clostridiales bacterium]|jgi:D-alanyl-D-alanine carboxypeptidase (penicillin-binding protein 5/6)|nr:D-alanyl-D-alanine carboxypeptidase [Clostridiales bacterium]
MPKKPDGNVKKLFFAALFFAALILGAAAPTVITFGVPAESSAEAMCVLEASARRVLYEKNADARLANASTTKILTAITVLENCPDIKKIHRVPDCAAGVEGSSVYLEKGEPLSVEDLLYGLMLQSGNDCAEALAIITSGSLGGFAALMNGTAAKAGAKNSNFITPHGLDRDGHFTTARDLALITAYALQNPEFSKIAAAKRYSAPRAGKPGGRLIINKNRLLDSFEGCDGVKTGYTSKAGRCYVSSATRDGMRVVSVVLNCGPMFEECAAFMSRAFNEYKPVAVLQPLDSVGAVKIEECADEQTQVGSLDMITLPLANGEAEALSFEICGVKRLKAPQKAGTEVGILKITLQNELLFEGNLYIIEDAGAKNLSDRLRDIADGWSRE